MSDLAVIVRNNGPYRLEGEAIMICSQAWRVYGLALRTFPYAVRIAGIGGPSRRHA